MTLNLLLLALLLIVMEERWDCYVQYHQ